jgi:hypothetical protein
MDGAAVNRHLDPKLSGRPGLSACGERQIGSAIRAPGSMDRFEELIAASTFHGIIVSVSIGWPVHAKVVEQ